MPTTTTANMIYFGAFPDIDPDESNRAPEDGPGILNDRTATSDTLRVVEVTLLDNNDDGEISDNDQGDTSGDTMTYTANGRTVEAQSDTSMYYQADILLGDGSTLNNVKVLVVQSTSGDVFIADAENGGDLDGLNIQAITLRRVNDDNLSGFSPNESTDGTIIVCFAGGTMIATERGQAAIEDLKIGDLVRTQHHGMQPIRWIGRRKISAELMAAQPRLRPIRISARALGQGLPRQDLLVSPQHRILIDSPIAQRMFGAREILIAAKKLIGLPGIAPVEATEAVTYFHILFDRHEVIFGNGAPSESLYTGPEALRAIPAEAQEELRLLFPGLFGAGHRPEPACTFADSGRRVMKLVARHRTNQKPMLSPRASTEACPALPAG